MVQRNVTYGQSHAAMLANATRGTYGAPRQRPRGFRPLFSTREPNSIHLDKAAGPDEAGQWWLYSSNAYRRLTMAAVTDLVVAQRGRWGEGGGL